MKVRSCECGVRNKRFFIPNSEFRIPNSVYCSDDSSLHTPHSEIRNHLVVQSGQALLELAIFGLVTIAALGFLLRIGLQANFEQETRMASFRRALAAASADDRAGPDGVVGTPDDVLGQDARATTVHLISERQMANPADAHMALPRTRFQASSFVEWGDRLTFSYMVDQDGDGRPDLPDDDRGQLTRQQIIVRANEAERAYRQDDFMQLDEIEQLGDATVEKLLSRSIVTRSFTLNLSTGGGGSTVVAVTQSHQAGVSRPINTRLQSKTTTDSTTRVNTRDGDVLPSHMGALTPTIDENW